MQHVIVSLILTFSLFFFRLFLLELFFISKHQSKTIHFNVFKDIGVAFFYSDGTVGNNFLFVFFFLGGQVIDFRSFFVSFPSHVHFISSPFFYTYDEYMMTKRFMQNLIKRNHSNITPSNIKFSEILTHSFNPPIFDCVKQRLLTDW